MRKSQPKTRKGNRAYRGRQDKEVTEWMKTGTHAGAPRPLPLAPQKKKNRRTFAYLRTMSDIRIPGDTNKWLIVDFVSPKA